MTNTPESPEQIIKDFIRLVYPWAVTARINQGMFYIYSGEPEYHHLWSGVGHIYDYVHYISNALGLNNLTSEEEKTWRMDF